MKRDILLMLKGEALLVELRAPLSSGASDKKPGTVSRNVLLEGVLYGKVRSDGCSISVNSSPYQRQENRCW